MIDKRTIFEIHRLNNMQFTIRSIARQLGLDRGTVKKYLHQPDQVRQELPERPSKLDAFRGEIREMVNTYPRVKAPVIMQHIQKKGFTGEITIVRDYLRDLRQDLGHQQAFIRFESRPGEQFQMDWGHFGSLIYGKTSRKLYALAVIEAHSRMLYVVFTHSQDQATLHQCLVHAFQYFGGTPNELLVDNMRTAVTERVGTMIRFNNAFLDFARRFGVVPKACHIRAPHEKGKVENSIRYLRNNFWPLRHFTDLDDVNHQVQVWLDTANQRVHQTTGEKPATRFIKGSLKPLPDPLPDYRQTDTVIVHKDFGIRFDVNVYTVPPRLVGKNLTLKADNRTLSIYHKEQLVATHTRKWERNLRVELPTHAEQIKKLRKRILMDRQMMVFISLGQEAVDYLEKLTDASQPLRKTVARLLWLQDQYGTASLICALRKALDHKLYGADYVQNILYQEMTPVTQHPPVALKNEDLNQIRLVQPNLAEYDALALSRRKK